MNLEQKVDAFVAKYNGVYVDEDGYYGSQCWDLVARYAKEVWGCPFLPTGSGGAEGLYRLYYDPIPQFFDRVPAGELRKGDIVVWSSDFYPPYGHTALLWKREGSTIFVLEEDGSYDPNHDNNADGVAYIAQRTITSKVAGGLRPKAGGAYMDKNQAVFLAQRIGLLAGMSEAEITADWVEYHANHIVADPNYAAGLAKQLYESSKWQNFAYRAVHYEADVAAAAGTGNATVLKPGLYKAN